jgi:excisionase family DNA binding protein
MRKRGDITAYKMGGKIVFKKEEIEEYLENLQQAA